MLKIGTNKEKKYQNPTTTLNQVKVRKMQVKVHYISLVKTYTNKSQDEFTLPDKTVLSELLDKIADNYGKPFTKKSMTQPRKR